jgi:hypothetical protein
MGPKELLGQGITHRRGKLIGGRHSPPCEVIRSPESQERAASKVIGRTSQNEEERMNQYEHQKKLQHVEEQLERLENRLANAREYVANNVNVRGTSWLHFEDWKGKSGHPAWMKNYMMPRTMKGTYIPDSSRSE